MIRLRAPGSPMHFLSRSKRLKLAVLCIICIIRERERKVGSPTAKIDGLNSFNHLWFHTYWDAFQYWACNGFKTQDSQSHKYKSSLNACSLCMASPPPIYFEKVKCPFLSSSLAAKDSEKEDRG